ncbi:mitochondrial fission ELM1 family protein [Paralimibaculum aggregatum]|uniref:Mitochondrial fission ELM1 family protein n=1 Tax=Paralimibaculum aggregatum TaxID=3036245 RepID=A0ABQ6LRI7_9RHOB|nr:mitochondrial fission ELM1 family protein [Limibaculum sp. NKW23]GMG84248.1 mitochondrial fission ELM1 family protein [Limibaculum sp. NKW23]
MKIGSAEPGGEAAASGAGAAAPRAAGARIWAVSDGRAGNAAQALGLAEAVARQTGAAVAPLELPPGRFGAALPASLWHGAARLMPKALGLAHGNPALAAAKAVAPGDLAIGAGRRVAPLVAWLGRSRNARTVQLLDPQMPLGAFDLVVAPEHDAISGPNTLASLGALGRVTRSRVAEAAAPLRKALRALPEPRLAVLLGGPGRMAGWSEADAARFLAAMEALAGAGWSLLLTASRRSDPALVAQLAARLDPARHLVHSGSGDNPYPGMLGLADAVVVTADSVNMVSEAACTGLPIHVFELARPSAKARRFHDALQRRGITRPFAGAIEDWCYPPLAEADRIATILVERLGPGRSRFGA